MISKRMCRPIAMVSLIAGLAGPALGNTGTVDEVLSGDLVRFGESFVARLTGIKAPPRSSMTGYRIYDFTKREIEGKVVRLFTWTTDNTAAGIVYDGDGRAFVQIYYGKGMETSFNELLLKKGYARVDEEFLPDDLKHYLELEEEAREKGLGIWADEE
jgi:endonuclease YncB( thermonuclease family)